MKRCPQCNRTEAEDTLTFCRVDGTPLARESGAVRDSAGTLKFSPSQGAGTGETRILPTGEALGRPTAPTTVLDARPASGDKRELSEPKSRRWVIVAAAAIVAIAVAASAFVYLSRGENAIAKNSIAVLPFANASQDPNMEYLSDGISESLINSLSQLPDVKVLARSTMFRFKGQDADPQAVGRQLGADTVLTGRVVQVGDSLSVQADLVNVADGTQLWGERYHRKSSDVLAVQEDIAREIVGRMRARLPSAGGQGLARGHTQDSEAYRLYLLGRFYWNKRTGEDLRKSIDYFNQAIARDPSYALAYVGLADAYVVLPSNSSAPASETHPKAKAAAQRALELDGTLGEAFATLAAVKSDYEWDFAAADGNYRSAIALSPNYATAHQWYGEYLGSMGRGEESLAELSRARELDPLSLVINNELGFQLMIAGRHDEAIAQLRKTLDLDAGFAPVHRTLGWCYLRKGMTDEALAEFWKALALSGDSPFELSQLACALAKAGRRDEARKIVERLLERQKREFVDWADIAFVYAALGERDAAFASLEKAYQAHSSKVTVLKVEPALDDKFRVDPRFADLVRRVGLPQ